MAPLADLLILCNFLTSFDLSIMADDTVAVSGIAAALPDEADGNPTYSAASVSSAAAQLVVEDLSHNHQLLMQICGDFTSMLVSDSTLYILHAVADKVSYELSLAGNRDGPVPACDDTALVRAAIQYLRDVARNPNQIQVPFAVELIGRTLRLCAPRYACPTFLANRTVSSLLRFFRRPQVVHQLEGSFVNRLPESLTQLCRDPSQLDAYLAPAETIHAILRDLRVNLYHPPAARVEAVARNRIEPFLGPARMILPVAGADHVDAVEALGSVSLRDPRVTSPRETLLQLGRDERMLDVVFRTGTPQLRRVNTLDAAYRVPVVSFFHCLRGSVWADSTFRLGPNLRILSGNELNAAREAGIGSALLPSSRALRPYARDFVAVPAGRRLTISDPSAGEAAARRAPVADAASEAGSSSGAEGSPSKRSRVGTGVTHDAPGGDDGYTGGDDAGGGGSHSSGGAGSGSALT